MQKFRARYEDKTNENNPIEKLLKNGSKIDS